MCQNDKMTTEFPRTPYGMPISPTSSDIPRDHILLVIGRNDENKKSRGIESLLQRLEEHGVSVHFYESKFSATKKLLEACFFELMPSTWQLCKKDSFLSKKLRKTILSMLLLCYPSKWDFVFLKFQERHHTSTQALTRFIRRQEKKRFTLISHSAGGIAGSLVEHLENVTGHICFGYPFKHPNRPEEPRRTRHLGKVKKPFLIIQGNQDKYGNSQSASRYTLSPAITLRPIEAEHDYEDIPPTELEAVLADLLEFTAAQRQVR